MTVLDGVENDLKAMPTNIQRSGVAALARAMATKIDTGKGSPSECAKVALDALGVLRGLAPEEVKADGIDQLEKRRQRRRAAS